MKTRIATLALCVLGFGIVGCSDAEENPPVPDGMIDDRPVVSEWRRKSVSVENTYDEDLPDLQSCLQKLPALIESLQPRLQRLDADYRIQNCFLKMKFFDFNQTTVERQQTAPNIDDYAMLCEEAWLRAEVPVRLLGLGVRLIDLTDDSGQMDLFEELAE